MEAKIDFGEGFLQCFFRMRSGIDFGSFFRGSNLEKSLKTIGFSMVFVIFEKNRCFRKNIEKTWILGWISEAKAMKNREKMVLKTMCFFDIDFSSLFFDFS